MVKRRQLTVHRLRIQITACPTYTNYGQIATLHCSKITWWWSAFRPLSTVHCNRVSRWGDYRTCKQLHRFFLLQKKLYTTILVDCFLYHKSAVVRALSNYIRKLPESFQEFYNSPRVHGQYWNCTQNQHNRATRNVQRYVHHSTRCGLVGKDNEWFRNLLLKSSILSHLKIKHESVITTYLVPQSEADSLIRNAKEKTSFMLQIGIRELWVLQ